MRGEHSTPDRLKIPLDFPQGFGAIFPNKI
jgi:hypothetical protein